MSQTFEIKNRYTGEVLFSYELQEGQESGMIARHAAEAAIAADADLRDADLYGADLRGADLYGANLRDADLRGADLRGANLRGADLYGANLRDADLRGADLRGADLRDADLYGADLRGADLYGANLRDADLRDADLYGAKNAPLLINGYEWIVVIDGFGKMQIGCQHHTLIEWAAFDDDQISGMASTALAFWQKNKAALMAFAEAHKHEAEVTA